MKLSTRGRYGIHAMYQLALDYGKSPLPIKAIAERASIPEAYLEQLISVLRKDELVLSTRGAQGGYMLSRPPEDISVGDMLRSLEGGLKLVDCLDEEEVCGKSCACPSRIVWKRINDGLNEIVNGISLKDMMDEYENFIAQGE